jgi:hypothetical protein
MAALLRYCVMDAQGAWPIHSICTAVKPRLQFTLGELAALYNVHIACFVELQVSGHFVGNRSAGYAPAPTLSAEAASRWQEIETVFVTRAGCYEAFRPLESENGNRMGLKLGTHEMTTSCLKDIC